MASRNGTRQPHAARSSALSTWVITMYTVAERMDPTGEPSCGMAAKNARRTGEECSVAMRMDPPHSPPSDRPCAMRSAMRRAAPSHPACA